MNKFRRVPKRFLLFTFLSCYVLFRVFYFVVVTSRMKEILVKPAKSLRSSWVIQANAWSKQAVVTPRADCKRIINGDKEEISRAKKIMKNYPKKAISCQDFLNRSKNCSNYQNERGYILRALRKREKEFPIAYSMMIHKDIEQFERLLRAIYRPQNYYCIHIDKKSTEIFHRAVEGISDCFPNVFIATSLVNVKWGEISLLRAYLNCMDDLYKRYKDWKYFINVSGQEFPLKTNNELVKFLKSLNGKSMVAGSKPKKRKILKRFHYVYQGRKRTNTLKTPFRYNFTIYKGSTYVALSHDFANFTLNSHVANEFLEWVKDTGIPDETFLPSLFANFPSPANPQNRKTSSATRYTNWGNKPCHGKIVREICINGVGDLGAISRGKAMFVNKFHLDYQYLALDCLEEWFYNRTLAYYQGKLKTSTTSVNKKRR